MQNIRIIHIAMLLSVVVHGALLIEFSGFSSAGKKPMATPSQLIYVKTNLPLPPEWIQPEREQQTESLPEAEPVVEPKKPGKVRPRKKTENKIPVKRRRQTQTASTATQPAAPLQHASITSIVETRQSYILQVLEKIDKQKSYPLQARRRRTSGSVTLAIRLSSRGLIEKLNCMQGPATLCRAAVTATKKAQPFPTLPEGTDHLAFEYQMQYRLR